MDVTRSTFYRAPAPRIGEVELLAAITAICDEFEAYGWRRVQAALRHQGFVANHKRIKRLMREHGLQPRRRRRYVATTDSAHDLPIFADLAKTLVLTGPDQLWVADLTYVAIRDGFAYVAIILDAWSRRVVGYAIGRSIDARLAIAALKTAVASRRPPPGLVHHSDRRSQYAAAGYREMLAANGIVGSMSRRGNPYDNAKAESFMKNAQGRGGLSDGIRDLRGSHRFASLVHWPHLQSAPFTFRPGLPQPGSVRGATRPPDGKKRRPTCVRPKGPTPNFGQHRRIGCEPRAQGRHVRHAPLASPAALPAHWPTRLCRRAHSRG